MGLAQLRDGNRWDFETADEFVLGPPFDTAASPVSGSAMIRK